MNGLTPNALAAKLDQLAKENPPPLEGLQENQRKYVRHARKTLIRFQHGEIGAGQALAERRGHQIKYLQKPIDQQTIELWLQEEKA